MDLVNLTKSFCYNREEVDKMSNLFLGYKKCSTCNNAEKYLKDLNIEYDRRELTENTPTVDELRAWHKLSNTDLKKFFNTRGQVYRDLELKDKYDTLTDEERYQLLSNNGMLIKRPLFISEDSVVIGFDKKAYDKL